jgi:hypothetical protein
MTLKYETGQLFYIGSEEPPTDDFILYDKIIGREEYTEPEKGGGRTHERYRVERFDKNGDSIRKITLDEEDIDEALENDKVELIDSPEEAFKMLSTA